MGEIVKILGKGFVGEELIELELNSPNNDFSSEQVHIQTKNRRLEISKDDFVKYASLVLLAEKNLKHLKNAK